MKTIRCARCNRDVKMPDRAIPELFFHHCEPTPFWRPWNSYRGTTSEEAREAGHRAAIEELGGRS